MNAEEAWKIAHSEETRIALEKQEIVRTKTIIDNILDKVKRASEEGKTHIIYVVNSYMSDVFREEEFMAFRRLEKKMNYKVSTVWRHPLTRAKISWKHALTKQPNDVIKDMLKPSLWDRIKSWFK